jgi:hypothetical protein
MQKQQQNKTDLCQQLTLDKQAATPRMWWSFGQFASKLIHFAKLAIG